MIGRLDTRPGHTAAIVALLLTVLAALLTPWPSATVHARRYGKKYSYAGAIARCKRGCGQTNGVISSCRGRYKKAYVASCRKAAKANAASCAGDPSCKKEIRGNLRACIKQAGTDAAEDRKATNPGLCNRCCQKSKGGGDCADGYFSDSRFFGSARYKGKLQCASNYGQDDRSRRGFPSRAFLGDGRLSATDFLRSQLVTLVHALAARLAH